MGLLLVGLTLTWGPSDRTINSLAEAAMIAGVFFRTLIAVQLAVVLLAAPAATAGAICVDKSRGTLLHAFVTDLTDREIVLGKLGARLVPVLSLMACGLPVLALGSLLGGIDLASVLGAELVTAGAAVLCCSLAFLASVWARKPHQALLLSYLLVGLWVAVGAARAFPFSRGASRHDSAALSWTCPTRSSPPSRRTSPRRAGRWACASRLAFFLAALLIASGLIGLAIRSAAADGPGPSEPAGEARAARCAGAAAGLLAGALARRQCGALARVASQTALALDRAVLDGVRHRLDPGQSLRPRRVLFLAGDPSFYRDIHVVAAHVNAWQVAIGLLLLSVSAATTLAEERDRGSLDVIMTTPLTTREIVWGKWWGTFAMVPRLAILPIWVAARRGDGERRRRRPDPDDRTDSGVRGGDHEPRPGAGDLGPPAWPRRLHQRAGVRPDRGRLALAAASAPNSPGVPDGPVGTAAGLARALPGEPVLRHLRDDRAGVLDVGRLERSLAVGRWQPVFNGEPALAPLLDRRVLGCRHGPDVRDAANLRSLHGSKRVMS